MKTRRVEFVYPLAKNSAFPEANHQLSEITIGLLDLHAIFLNDWLAEKPP